MTGERDYIAEASTRPQIVSSFFTKMNVAMEVARTNCRLIIFGEDLLQTVEVLRTRGSQNPNARIVMGQIGHTQLLTLMNTDSTEKEDNEYHQAMSRIYLAKAFGVWGTMMMEDDFPLQSHMEPIERRIASLLLDLDKADLKPQERLDLQLGLRGIEDAFGLFKEFLPFVEARLRQIS